jgi:hypothetical protein
MQACFCLVKRIQDIFRRRRTALSGCGFGRVRLHDEETESACARRVCPKPLWCVRWRRAGRAFRALRSADSIDLPVQTVDKSDTHDRGILMAERYGFGVYDALTVASARLSGGETHVLRGHAGWARGRRTGGKQLARAVRDSHAGASLDAATRGKWLRGVPPGFCRNKDRTARECEMVSHAYLTSE